MRDDTGRSVARIDRKPFHPLLVPLSAACFIGALVTDVAYWWSPAVQWETFSIWLITAGLVVAGLAVLAGLIDVFRFGTLGEPWLWILSAIFAVGLSFINAFVHSRDGYTAVVPTGIALSAVVVLAILVAAWAGRTMLSTSRKTGVV